MKYVVSLLAGIVFGAALFLALIYYNPFAGKHGLSPLTVSGGPQMELSYSPVVREALAFTSSGHAGPSPRPEEIAELWEPSVRRTRVLVTTLHDVGGEIAGIGVKFSSDSEATRLLDAEVLVDSAWQLWLPDRGTLFVNQTENYWSYLRTIVLPARLSSGNSWRGSWYGTMTSGPGALGTGKVTGGSGEFAGLTSEAIESLNARAWSAGEGPVAMTGNILVSLSDQTAD